VGSPSPCVEAIGLDAGYEGPPVLRSVSWRVHPGELWAVLGPNGAGKSTLLKSCMALVPPSAGILSVFGREIGEWDRPSLARRLAWVPQRFDAEGGFTALEIALMGRSPYLGIWGLPSRSDIERTLAVLTELGAGHLAQRRTSALSGGEQRLVWLARALVQAPELLLLDEPTAFLDLHRQVEALTCVKSRTKSGLSAIAVLHDVNLAAAFADHALLLREGRVLAAGPTADVLSAPAVEALYGISMSHVQTQLGQRLFAPRLPL
jgi:iron complex transport system ATP-binding protein